MVAGCCRGHWHSRGWDVAATVVAGVGAQPLMAAGARPGQWGQPLWESCLNSVQELFLKIKSSCSSLLLLTSTRPLTKPNFSARLQTIWVKVHHCPILLHSPGVAWLPNFSGNDPASIHSLWVNSAPVGLLPRLYSLHQLQASRSPPGAALSSLFGRGGSC